MAESLVPQQQSSGSILIEMDYGSASEMARRLNDMKQKLGLVQKFFKDVMEKDVDYGVIPGTNKPTLLKPGAEKLCELYNFAPVIASKEEEKDMNTGYYRAKVVIRLIHRGTGVTVAEGIGEANTFENRYRWRWVPEWKLPAGIDKSTLVSEKRESKSGQMYLMYRMENDDLFSLWNTVLKMAKKRALVDATLSATRSSGIFSQSEDEMEAWVEGEGVEEDLPKPPKSQQPAPPQRQSQTQQRSNGNTASPATKNRAIELMKKAGLDWNGLAVEASKILNRDIKKVVQDVNTEADWQAICAHLESMIDGHGQDQGAFNIDDDDLPPDFQDDLFGGEGR